MPSNLEDFTWLFFEKHEILSAFRKLISKSPLENLLFFGFQKKNIFKNFILSSKETWFYGYVLYFLGSKQGLWGGAEENQKIYFSFCTLSGRFNHCFCEKNEKHSWKTWDFTSFQEIYFQKSLRESIIFGFPKKNLFFQISFYRLSSHDFIVFCWYFFDSKQGLSGRNRRNSELYLSVFARWAAGSITVFLKKSEKSEKT